jgi:hypothetical protein
MKAGISSALRKPVSLFRKAGPLFSKIGSLFRRIGSSPGKVGALLSIPIQKLRLLPPFRRIDRAWQRTGKEPKRLQYRFLPYVTSVLRVLGWAVLIVGVLASIVLGWEIINDGLTVWEIEVRGVGIGVSAIVLGVIGSFLAWLFLLVARELVCLFIQVKDNTRNTAASMTE